MINSYNDLEIGETSSAYYKTNFLGSRPCQKDIRGHTGCVNSISLSDDEKYLTSGGDDGHVYIWRVNDMILEKSPKPKAIMQTTHESNIFATEMTNDNSIVYSGGRDSFVLKHNIETGQLITRFPRVNSYDSDVHSIQQCRSNDNLIAIARNNRVATFDTRSNEKIIICQNLNDDFHNSEFNPETPYLFLVCSSLKGPLIYDLRNVKGPLSEFRQFYGDRYFSYFETFKKNMYSTWSPSGRSFASLHSKHFPICYDLNARVQHICQDETYVNIKTMKSIAFLDERTIATGSDENTIFIWKIPEIENIDSPSDMQYFQQKTLNRSTKTLIGHRSIPNQIRYCESSEVIFSSGVENSIKMWSMKTLPWSYDEPFVRRKQSEYDDLFVEIERERAERREYEKSLEEGAMDGRATWEDVFGGDQMTAESRETCEAFDMGNLMEIDYDDLEGNFRNLGDDVEGVRIQRHYFANLLSDFSSDASENSDNDDGGRLFRIPRIEPAERRRRITGQDVRRIFMQIMRREIHEANDDDDDDDEERENDFDAEDEDNDDGILRYPLVRIGGSDDEEELVRMPIGRIGRIDSDDEDEDEEEEEEENERDDYGDDEDSDGEEESNDDGQSNDDEQSDDEEESDDDDDDADDDELD